ncbi:hypothetical protein [Sphingomonas sp. SORGH_AS_0879]|uniref:hypothetical protein n=1 Tax=Sphingomonas sp. SORGH_AS_0879 TaxID=3041790 RepID=UPI00278B42DE|nr:hypothetical protein [Sphingomonas sp. SORGH_AS_0879]MDQ1229484.1 hypothetical protein [Sphingomonas sp. SORGH_AS_0879]
MALSSATRRYQRRVILLAILYAALLFSAVYLLNRHMVGGAAAYLIGVLPALPVIGFFVAIGLYMTEERDEYLRMLLVRQSLIATGLSMTGATLWGFLEGFDLLPHLVGYAWPILWFGGLGLGSCVNRFVEGRTE